MPVEQSSSLNPDLCLEAYHYDLPEALIARYPLAQRDQSRMLVMNRAEGSLQHHQFSSLPDYLTAGDVVVVNNTQVLPARLLGHRLGYTGKVEILLLYPSEENPLRWTALMKPTRKLPPGTVVEFPGTKTTVEILGQSKAVRGEVLVHLVDHESVAEFMQAVGQLPIPPYLGRAAEPSDQENYQTVYAKVPGAHAAPTAGLHFTPKTLDDLKQKGIQVCEVTLAVSTGTFKKVDAQDIREHVMDPEFYTISSETAQAIEQAKTAGKKVLAVGTTVMKTLETSAAKHQGQIVAESDWSRMFIYPGIPCQVVDHLLTNFHLPQTTLMMLISAFSSREQVLQAYRVAVQEQYRFFSYGDCMLIL